MAARLVDDNEAIAAVAVGENEAAFFERGLEPLAAVGALEAVENGGADLPHIGAEAAGFFFLGTPRRLRPVFRFPRAVQLTQPKIALEISRQLLEVVLIQAGIDHPHFFKIEAAPADMHVLLAVVVNVEGDDARLAFEAEPLFLAVGNLHPLLARQFLVGWKPVLGMKERLGRAGVLFGDQLQRFERFDRIAAEVVDAARLDKFHSLAGPGHHEIPGEVSAVAVEITLRDHGSTPPVSLRVARQAHPAHRVSRRRAPRSEVRGGGCPARVRQARAHSAPARSGSGYCRRD